MKLRLYHHPDGARIAYREAGTGPPLALVHSAGLSHREFEPLVEELGDRFRLVLPDLPLHGDSEDRPRHSYSPDWLAEVLAGFVRDTCGPAAAGRRARDRRAAAAARGALAPAHAGPARAHVLAACTARRCARRAGPGPPRTPRRCPGSTASPRTPRGSPSAPPRAPRLSARGNPAARDLVRHATMDLGGNVNRARAWSKAVRRWPRHQPELLDAYRLIDVPVLLLWADEDALHPLAIAEEARDLLPDAILRVLPGTGFLLAYDDPVGPGARARRVLRLTQAACTTISRPAISTRSPGL